MVLGSQSGAPGPAPEAYEFAVGFGHGQTPTQHRVQILLSPVLPHESAVGMRRCALENVDELVGEYMADHDGGPAPQRFDEARQPVGEDRDPTDTVFKWGGGPERLRVALELRRRNRKEDHVD